MAMGSISNLAIQQAAGEFYRTHPPSLINMGIPEEYRKFADYVITELVGDTLDKDQAILDLPEETKTMLFLVIHGAWMYGSKSSTGEQDLPAVSITND
jgi:hypothetical protein